ncbi:MAG: hypothetical protein AAGE98_14645 [Actinomycetota bacterium]
MFLFIVIGAGIFAFLGVMHGLATLTSTPERGAMTPTDPHIQQAMQTPGGIGLAPDLATPLWRPWLGFNLSHSIGALVLAGVIAIPALRDVAAAVDDPVWVGTSLGVPAVLLVVSVRFWFAKPTQAIALATALIWLGVLAELV